MKLRPFFSSLLSLQLKSRTMQEKETKKKKEKEQKKEKERELIVRPGEIMHAEKVRPGGCKCVGYWIARFYCR